MYRVHRLPAARPICPNIRVPENIILLGPSYTKNFLEFLISQETQISRIFHPILNFSREKISRFLGVTLQNNFARLNLSFFSRFTYLEFFHSPILAKKSRDFLSQGILDRNLVNEESCYYLFPKRVRFINAVFNINEGVC